MTIRELKNLIHQLNPIKLIKARIDRPDWLTSPPEIADRIKGLIQDKIVCDLGCRKGYFMLALKKYAAIVIGIEKEKHFYRLTKKRVLEEKGMNVYLGDFLKDPLPPADVYYIWAKPQKVEVVLNKLRARKQKGKLVVGKKTEKGWEIEVIDI